MDREINLTPEGNAESEPFLATSEEYEEFCRKFIEEVGPELEKQRQARQESEFDAKQRWIL